MFFPNLAQIQVHFLVCIEIDELGSMVPIACPSKNRKVSWKIQRNFQDTWIAKFPRLSYLEGKMVKSTTWSAKFAQKLNARINFWCPSWTCFINIVWEGNVSDLNLDIKLMNFAPILIINMQKMRGYMSLHGMIMLLTTWFWYWPNDFVID